jgi:hypothetical protein
LIVKEPNKISAAEITDPAVYFNRRTFMRVGILAASTVATGLIYRGLNHVGSVTTDTPLLKKLATFPTATGMPTDFA